MPSRSCLTQAWRLKETLNNSSLNCQSPETENAIFGFLTKSIPYGD